MSMVKSSTCMINYGGAGVSIGRTFNLVFVIVL
jgi:hypothetical protein